MVPDGQNGPADTSHFVSVPKLYPGALSELMLANRHPPLPHCHFFPSSPAAFLSLSLCFFACVWHTCCSFLIHGVLSLAGCCWAHPGWSGPSNWCLPTAEIAAVSSGGPTNTTSTWIKYSGDITYKHSEDLRRVQEGVRGFVRVSRVSGCLARWLPGRRWCKGQNNSACHVCCPWTAGTKSHFAVNTSYMNPIKGKLVQSSVFVNNPTTDYWLIPKKV